jgi:heme/copper-type cytochrome/quinol oxidase subunit 3
MTDERHLQNSASGEVNDNASVVQVHHVSGDVLLLTGAALSTAQAMLERSSAKTRKAVVALTAFAAILTLGGLVYERITTDA